MLVAILNVMVALDICGKIEVMAKILIIEDDLQIADEISMWLQRDKNTVDHCSNGEDGLYRLTHYDYDLAIVDWNLPDIQGVDICKRIHELKTSLSLLMLTSRAETLDRIRGLDSGAMDYLVKPCDLRELSARIRALLRRAPAANQTSKISVFDLIIDPLARTVYRENIAINFSATEFDILVSLAKSQGNGVARKEIAIVLGRTEKDLKATLRTLNARIRKKLSLAGSSVKLAFDSKSGYTLCEHVGTDDHPQR